MYSLQVRKHWDKIIDAQEFMMWCFCVSVEEKKNRPFTKLSVTWKSSAVVFLACCVFHLEAARVAFPGRHGCILVIMQVNVGWFFSDVVENWHHIALKEMIYDLKIKTDIIEEGLLDVIWILSVVENRKDTGLQSWVSLPQAWGKLLLSVLLSYLKWM